MRKYYFLISLVIIAILSVNLFLYFDIYQQQIDFQKNFLINQTQICTYEIDKVDRSFPSDLNYITFSEDLPSIFSNPAIQQSTIKKIELFYSSYRELIENILLYDDERNVFSLFEDSNRILTDIFVSQSQKALRTREGIETINGDVFYFIPVFRENRVVFNIQVGLNYEKYLKSEFSKFQVKNIQWQWVVNDEGELLLDNASRYELRVPRLHDITGKIAEGFMGDLQHTVYIDGEEQDVISVYTPASLIGKEFGIIFSLQTNYIRGIIIRNTLLISLITLILVGLIIFIFLSIIRRKNFEKGKLKESEESLRQIIDNFPVGILLLGKDKKIVQINSAAADLLGMEDGKDLSGTEIPGNFLSGKSILGQDGLSPALDPTQFIHFEKDGGEVVIYKKQIPISHKGGEISLEALIDITPIERARKQEAAANKAKSDFLVRMSHEIRAPLHGIIELTEAIDTRKLSAEQKDFARSIRKSSDLLLSIIDDLMDLSKIEAGKIMLEEIPFRLRDEIGISVNLFRAKAEKRNLGLGFTVDENVPDHLIGDPFRLRQVISNLLDNAVKFTHKGEIRLTITLLEARAGNISLHFCVEDSGIGIPADRLEYIFSPPPEKDNKKREPGGSGLGTSIARQLVELMNGKIWAESPSSIAIGKEYPGSRFCFTIKVFSNEKFDKKVHQLSIKKFHQVKTLIIQEHIREDDKLLKTLQGFGISTYVNCFQENTIELLKNNANQTLEKYKLIILRDTPSFDGFTVAMRLFEEKLAKEFLMLLVSSNDKAGNYIRARRLMIDHYIIEPFKSSEIFDIVQDNFPGILPDNGTKSEIMDTKRDIAILVADDNPINQKVAQAIFKNLGYEIDIAANGLEVVEKVKSREYDIIFMDVMMPEMDGMEAADEIRKLGKDIPIIAVTADINQEAGIRSRSTSMNDFIAKPVKVDEIKRVLIEWYSKPAT